MTLEKAVKILGISLDFTEAEFKKAYRELCKLYHPDKVGKESEEKQKELNEAADFIKKYLKEKNIKKNNTSKNTANNSRDIDIDEYKNQKIESIKRIISFSNYEIIIELQSIKEIITDLEYDVSFDLLAIEKLTNKSAIDYEYQEITKKIQEEFKKLKNIFYQEKDINETDVKEKLNYNCTISEFYKQLIKIKEKYSKIDLLDKRLDQEIDKYKGYAYYDNVKNSIKKCKEDTLSRTKRQKFQNIEQEINEMHNRIFNNIFKEYETIIELISKIEATINNIEDIQLKNRFIEIKKDLEKGELLSIIKKKVTIFEQAIENYQKSKLTENKSIEIYNMLLEKYMIALKDKNLYIDYNLVLKTNDLFKSLLELLKFGVVHLKGYNYFELFNQITFKDLENDAKIKKQIEFKTKKIYIRRKDTKTDELIDQKSFFLIDNNEEESPEYLIHRVEPTGVTGFNITKEELEDKYISLDEILKPENIVMKNKSENNNGPFILVIAETDGYLLYKKGDFFGISVNGYYHWVREFGNAEKPEPRIILNTLETYLQEKTTIFSKPKKK